MYTVKDILDVTEGKLIYGDVGYYCEGVSTDTRNIKPGELFIALNGERFDGHCFIPEALSKGANGFFFSNPKYFKNVCFNSYKVLNTNLSNGKCNSKFAIQVKDTLCALGQLANFHRLTHDPKVIAITGSVGKTTTKEFVAKILSYKFNVVKNLGTENNLIGVPVNIFKVNPSCEILVLELGTNKPGEISRLAQICQPDIGIVLNIGPSHLKYLKSLNGVKKEKLSLLKSVRSRGNIMINSDFVSREEVANCSKRNIITVGINSDADFRATRIRFLDNGINFRVKGKNYFAPITNKEYIYNILVGLAVASILSVSTEYFKKALSDFKVADRRFQKIAVKDNLIIDDTYNSNPMSMECALKGISKLNQYKRKIVICGDMLELGKYSSRYHSDTGRLIANFKIDLLFLIGNFSKYVKHGAIHGGMKFKNIKVFGSLEEISNEILLKLDQKDLILVKGSRAIRMDKLVDSLKRSLM